MAHQVVCHPTGQCHTRRRERWRSQAEAVQRLITGLEERNRRSQTEAARDHRPWWRQLAGPEGMKLIVLLGSILLMLGIIADKLK